MFKSISFNQFLLLFCVIALLTWVRAKSEVREQELSFYTWTDEVSLPLERVFAGSIPGLVSDFRILDVFSIHYDANVLGQKEVLPFLPIYLERAQNLDPKFYEVYQLAASILAYDAAMPEKAVELLQKGLVERPDKWEIPFYAGFLAHDLLKDDKLAFELMSHVVNIEGAPLMVMTLAARFLESSSTRQDAIYFLKGLLQLVPQEYRLGILQRIQTLESEEGK